MKNPESSKVIGFDGWIQGAHHYQRLVDAFKNKGLDLTLIHLGSWGNDVGRPKEEWIGNLQVRDISFYGRQSFPEILELEDPAAVIFLSTDTFLHRTFNRYCRHSNVATINLFHAIRGVVDNDDGLPFSMDRIAYLKFVASRLPRAFRHVWPAYSVALWKTNATFGEWVRFVGDIFRGALGIVPKVVADDARTDKCCVYINADIDYAIKTFGFTRGDVIAVGNPDLIRFGLSSDMIGSFLKQPSATRFDVMYVDTGFIAGGLVFKSEYEFVKHIVDTRDMLAQQGKHLLFKPHPSHSGTGVLSALANSGVEICPNETFVSRLQRCCACIVEPSSIVVFLAFLGMPLFLAKYGALRGQSFGKLLSQYPRARPMYDIHDFNSLLAFEQAECDEEKTMRWIEQNAGPLPAAEMPDRVANVVHRLISEKLQRE